MKPIEFNPTEKRIISILYTAGKPLPMERIANQLDMSVITVKKYLLELETKKAVKSKKTGKALYWWLSTS